MLVNQVIQSHNIRNLFGNTLTHKHVDYYICICYHQNLTLCKDKVNRMTGRKCCRATGKSRKGGEQRGVCGIGVKEGAIRVIGIA